MRLLNHVTWKMITEFGHPAAINNPKTVSVHTLHLSTLTFLDCRDVIFPAPAPPALLGQRVCVVQAPLWTEPVLAERSADPWGD